MQNTGEVYGQNGAVSVLLIHRRRSPGAQGCIFCRVLT